jgi:hypothetical protein
LLHLFMQDVLGRRTVAARIFENKFEEDFSQTSAVSKWEKIAAIACIMGLNIFFIYYSLLKAFVKGQAWQQTYLIACLVQMAVEMLLNETVECVWLNYSVPLLVASEVKRATFILKNVASKLTSSMDNLSYTGAKLQNKIVPYRRYFLNAPSYLFSSYKVAMENTYLLESLVVLGFKSHFPGELCNTWPHYKDHRAAQKQARLYAVSQQRSRYASTRYRLYLIIATFGAYVLLSIQALGTMSFGTQRVVLRFLQPLLFSGLTLLCYFATKQSPTTLGIMFGIAVALALLLFWLGFFGNEPPVEVEGGVDYDVEYDTADAVTATSLKQPPPEPWWVKLLGIGEEKKMERFYSIAGGVGAISSVDATGASKNKLTGSKGSSRCVQHRDEGKGSVTNRMRGRCSSLDEELLQYAHRMSLAGAGDDNYGDNDKGAKQDSSEEEEEEEENADDDSMEQRHHNQQCNPQPGEHKDGEIAEPFELQFLVSPGESIIRTLIDDDNLKPSSSSKGITAQSNTSPPIRSITSKIVKGYKKARKNNKMGDFARGVGGESKSSKLRTVSEDRAENMYEIDPDGVVVISPNHRQVCGASPSANYSANCGGDAQWRATNCAKEVAEVEGREKARDRTFSHTHRPFGCHGDESIIVLGGDHGSAIQSLAVRTEIPPTKQYQQNNVEERKKLQAVSECLARSPPLVTLALLEAKGEHKDTVNAGRNSDSKTMPIPRKNTATATTHFSPQQIGTSRPSISALASILHVTSSDARSSDGDSSNSGNNSDSESESEWGGTSLRAFSQISSVNSPSRAAHYSSSNSSGVEQEQLPKTQGCLEPQVAGEQPERNVGISMRGVGEGYSGLRPITTPGTAGKKITLEFSSSSSSSSSSNRGSYYSSADNNSEGESSDNIGHAQDDGAAVTSRKFFSMIKK